MNNAKLRAALVGCGNISSVHLEALSGCDFAEIVALCDVKEEKAIEKRDKFSLSCPVYTSY